MTIELWLLFAVAVSYLLLLFLIAYSADNGWLPAIFLDHPVIYVLSLGVYATSWTFYGSVGLANSSGLAFITIYLGITGAFMAGPWLLRPILRLVRDYQLASIADILAFRYGGRASGFTVTIFMIIGILPYLSLQIHAVVQSTQVILGDTTPALLALTFCIAITIFAILFGARHLTPRETHAGLVTAIAFESFVKLVALLIAGVFCVTSIFGGFEGLAAWSGANPEAVEALYANTGTNLWSTLLLLSFSAAFLLPRQYHMMFVENKRPESLNTAFWLFPLYLLLLNLPIIPILWAGKHLSLTIPPDYFVLGISMTLGNQWLTLLTYIGGLSAASAMMIVTSLALSYMCLNHLLLPASLSTNRTDTNIYRSILWSKRLIIMAIFAAGYGFYLIIESNQELADLGLISFVAAAQLLPGMLALLFWARATQAGFISGLLGGACIWFALLIYPLVSDAAGVTGIENMIERLGFADVNVWSFATFCSLTLNASLLAVVSLLTRPDAEQQQAALACTNSSLQPLAGTGQARSTVQLVEELEPMLGSDAAHQEVNRALSELNLNNDEHRPAKLHLLHLQLERNLSGLLGPTVARIILRGSAPLSRESNLALAESLSSLETRLLSSRRELRGVNRELESLRQYLRNVLQALPIGVCSVDSNGQILIWNTAMANMSDLQPAQLVGSRLSDLPEPWSELMSRFSASPESRTSKQTIFLNGRSVTLNLHKARLSESGIAAELPAGQVILVEDRTSVELLEQELAHSERLASIGRLAAGVAHEIGNPLTGVASLAQNLRYDSDLTDVRDSAEDILEQVNRINAIVKSLLRFSHADSNLSESRELISLYETVEEAIRLVQLSNQSRRQVFDNTVSPTLEIFANPQQMTQVFVNLLNNACDAQTDSPSEPIGISAQSGRSSENTGSENITIVIKDHGCGIEKDNLKRIFEPFYTSKPVGRGTGLGLSLVHSIITNHNGQISVNSRIGIGTTIELSLPAPEPMQPDIDNEGESLR